MTSHTVTPPIGQASGQAARRVWLRRLTLSVLAATFGLALLAPSSSLAAFTRPFVRQITGTPTGPEGSQVPFGISTLGGVAVDATDNLWVSEPYAGNEPSAGKLDEFSSAGSFVTPQLTLEGNLTPPASLAIDNSTGDFLVAGEQERLNGFPGYLEVFDSTGKLVKRWDRFGRLAHVVVDNSTDPFDLSAGSVYVAHGDTDPEPSSGGDGLPPGIEKFSASGEPVNFVNAKGEPTALPYVKGDEITGTPSGPFPENRTLIVAVDSEGNIYAAANEYALNVSEVFEFSSSGVFVRAFTGNETPGLGGHHEHGGFGGELSGLAVDPVSDHLLISVSGEGTKGPEGAVDEFDAVTGKFLNQITETSPGAHLHSPRAMAVDPNGDLYVVDSTPFSATKQEHAVDVYGPGHSLPGLKIAEASLRKPTSAVLSGSVNPGGLPLSECRFQYVAEEAFKKEGFSKPSTAECEPAASQIPADSNSHAVEAKLTGLVEGTTYRYRLIAANAGALGGTAASSSLAFTAPHAPAVDSTSATNLSSTFADLHAQINPLGANTTYQFQYVDEAHYNPAVEDPYATGVIVPVTAAGIGSGGPTGSAPESVLQQIGGLDPGTTYHFRVTATNEIGTTAGPDVTFTTLAQVSPGLPDHRAYELLTPPNKGSAEDMFANPITDNEFENPRHVGYPSESGDGFLLTTGAAFGLFPASGGNAYVFSRTPGGWQTTSLASPSLGVQSLGADDVFDPSDFSQVGVTDFVGSEGSEAGLRAMSLVGPPAGPYATLHIDSPMHFVGSGFGGSETALAGASHDLSDVVLQSLDHTLAPGAKTQDPGSKALYESAAGNFKLLNVNSKGSLLNSCGAVLGAYDNSGVQSPSGKARNAVSADGSRVFFTVPDPGAVNDGPGCWNGATTNAPQLYLRSGASTTEVSAPEKDAPEAGGHHPATYVGASEDGSKVFFVTETELTKDDEGIHDPELYEYNPETAKLTRVSAGEPGHAAADVQSVPVVSADGSAVYFTANGVLAKGASPGNCILGTPLGTCNLYRYDTSTGATAYLATVNASDWGSNAGQGIGLSTRSNWNTTPDGRYLLFPSSRDLTGYSTVSDVNGGTGCTIPESGGAHNGHCNELYRYDSATGNLICVSCNPSGAPPISNALFDRSAFDSPAAGAVRAISNDGSYVFFDTADALVPQATNHTLDVYEWHEGKISLISSGQDSAPSFFLGASPDGSNVFFGTHARLVPSDTDTAGDLYDARICTAGDPCIKPPPGETAQCEGDACQNPPPLPLAQAPATLTSASSGNVASEAKTQITPKNKVKPANVQKLAKALKTCRKKRKSQRRKCESQAHNRYAKKASKSARARHAKTSRRTGR